MPIPTLDEMIAAAEWRAAWSIEWLNRLKEFKKLIDNDPIVSAIRALYAQGDEPQSVGICCIEPTCPSYGDVNFGEGTCPQEHSPLFPKSAKPRVNQWSYFGTHANHRDPDSPCSYGGDLTFSESVGEDRFPIWEQHADKSDCPAAIVNVVTACPACTSGIRGLHHSTAVDKNGCHTAPDGTCVSSGPCLHILVKQSTTC